VERTEAIYQYLVDYIAEHGYAPVYREIAAGCDIPSLNAVRAHLVRLDELGRIQWSPGVTRGIVLKGANGQGQGQEEAGA
jgi:repressor LexA